MKTLVKICLERKILNLGWMYTKCLGGWYWGNIAYEFKDIVYNLSSPLNILYVGRVGQHFGSIESLPTNDEEVTWVKYCASYTNFTWDNGRLTCRFSHSYNYLPWLSVNIVSSKMSAFCSKLRRIHDEKVNFCFDNAVEYDKDDKEANAEDSGDDIVGGDYFKPGIDV